MSAYHDQLIKWLPKNTEWDVCYRASRDGWAANIFHNRCNDKGPTITIIRAGQYIFGEYTEASWARNGKLLCIWSSSICFILCQDLSALTQIAKKMYLFLY